MLHFACYGCETEKLSDRVAAFYEYHWLTFKGVNEQQIISELPSTLKQQIANQITCQLLCGLPILRRAPNALLNALASYIESNIYRCEAFSGRNKRKTRYIYTKLTMGHHSSSLVLSDLSGAYILFCFVSALSFFQPFGRGGRSCRVEARGLDRVAGRG